MSRLSRLISLKPFLIGMVHVRPLPGTPGYDPKISFQKTCDIAVEEATLMKKCGIDGLLIENMHDVPYVVGPDVGPEIVAHMTVVASSVRKILPDVPIGVQVLAAANVQAMAVAAAADLDFIRVEGFVFSHIADEGFIDACAGRLLRYRKSIAADKIGIFADIKKKHSSHAITADIAHSDVAEAARFCKADGVIVTGSATGHAPSASLSREVASSFRKCGPFPVLIGSGITSDNFDEFCRAGVSGFIVGSSLKKGGVWSNELDPLRVKTLVQRIRVARSN